MLRSILPVILCFSLHLKDSCAGTITPDTLIIREILIKGNYVTSEKLIFRELAFRLNNIIHRNEIEFLKKTSIHNLVKTSLFNFVEIDTAESLPGFLTFIISLTERWYIWPTGYLNHTDRNFSEWWRTRDLNKLQYGFGIKINNLRGMGETLKLNYRLGNFTKYELEYKGIFLDKAKCNSLSFHTSWSADKLLPYVIESDEQITLKEDFHLIRSFKFSSIYQYRKGYFNTHNIELGYTDDRIADTIYSLNPYYAGLIRNRLRYFNLKYEFRRDNRDSHSYPKTGHLLVAGFNRKGLNLIKDEYNSTDIFAQFYVYHKVADRFYIASGLWYHSVLDDEYVFSATTGLGYLDFVRGYEYYAVNGDNAFLFKSLVKFEIMPMKVINLKVWPVRNLHQFNRIPFEIYTNLFFDAGYVSDKSGFYKEHNNNLVGRAMYSTGISIDFVTYYDKVLRLDYSFNALGERGLFIHWKAAFR
jgi:outer membrane protein assembly factor BamA